LLRFAALDWRRLMSTPETRGSARIANTWDENASDIDIQLNG
jgi:hypothetical protein